MNLLEEEEREITLHGLHSCGCYLHLVVPHHLQHYSVVSSPSDRKQDINKLQAAGLLHFKTHFMMKGKQHVFYIWFDAFPIPISIIYS